jgi:hypothetical protein
VEDRDAADLAVVRDGHEEGGGDVEGLDQLAADLAGDAGVGHVHGGARRQHAGDGGGPAVEPDVVARQAGRRDGGQAAGAVLGDLEQVDAVDGQPLGERGDQLAAQLGRRARLRRGAGDAVQRALGGVTARS